VKKTSYVPKSSAARRSVVGAIAYRPPSDRIPSVKNEETDPESIDPMASSDVGRPEFRLQSPLQLGDRQQVGGYFTVAKAVHGGTVQPGTPADLPGAQPIHRSPKAGNEGRKYFPPKHVLCTSLAHSCPLCDAVTR